MGSQLALDAPLSVVTPITSPIVPVMEHSDARDTVINNEIS